MRDKKIRKYIVKTKYMAMFLIKNDCNFIGTDKDRFNPKYDVYIFEDSDYLREKLSEYVSNKNK